MHEHCVFGLEDITRLPIVLISTIGMIVGMVIGILMGLPRIRNSMAGWHKATAWFLLPLLVLSPLTGALMALRINTTYLSRAVAAYFNLPTLASELDGLLGGWHVPGTPSDGPGNNPGNPAGTFGWESV